MIHQFPLVPRVSGHCVHEQTGKRWDLALWSLSKFLCLEFLDQHKINLINNDISITRYIVLILCSLNSNLKETFKLSFCASIILFLEQAVQILWSTDFGLRSRFPFSKTFSIIFFTKRSRPIVNLSNVF